MSTARMEDVQQDIRKLDIKTVNRKIKNMVEMTLVPHTAFEEARAQIEQCFLYAIDADEPICLATIGESRTGKSRLLEEIEAAHPTFRNEEGLIIPIVRVKVPSKPTVKGLAETMLFAMRDPMAHVGTEQNKTSRLKKLMHEANTKMVMLDEFQHFQDKASFKIMHHVSDWLKMLVDETHTALIVAGLPECMAVINQNPQLAGRFFAPILLPRFSWTNAESRQEFIAILGTFHESLSRYFDLPNLSSNAMAFRFFCATGGLIGYLAKLLRQVVWINLSAGERVITLDTFALAHKRALWQSTVDFIEVNPFTEDFSTTPTVALLTKVNLIGTKPHPPVNKKAVTKPRQEPSANQILTAT